LARFFAQKYSRMFGRSGNALSDRILGAFTEYSWPGNVRELENMVKKIVALGSEDLALADLSTQPTPVSPSSRIFATRSLKAASRAASQQAERDLILQTLTRTHWNRKKAAEALQISYKSLLYKLKQIELVDSEEL